MAHASFPKEWEHLLHATFDKPQTTILPPKSVIKPNAVYGAQVGLRVGTGGSGQSGLLQALAEAFIAYHCQKTGVPQFQIEWYTSDTSVTIAYLKQGVVDVGITYHAVAEQTAVDEGVVDRVVYAFRDHWLLVGPQSNPAKLPEDQQTNIYVLFTKLFTALELASVSENPEHRFKFLSRYDKSACNITESHLWASIGQTPWAERESSWYHKLNDFPIQAITAAAELGEYTLTDYGTWCAVGPEVRSKLKIFAKGKDDETDPLLNPGHLLVATQAKNKDLATAFADWIELQDGGQKIVREFTRHGEILYTGAPSDVDPLAKAKGLFNPSGSTIPDRSIVRTASRRAGHENEIYFFKDKLYARIDAVTDKMTNSGAIEITKWWNDFRRIGWDLVDAFLPVSGTDETYVFRGAEFIRYHLSEDKVLEGPSSWANKWPILKQQGLDRIDVALPNIYNRPGTGTWAWFFRKDQAVNIDVSDGALVHKVDKITNCFPTLKQIGWETVDTAIFKPQKKGAEAYFFRDDEYVLVHLKEERILYGPKKVKDTWKSLVEAGFY